MVKNTCAWQLPYEKEKKKKSKNEGRGTFDSVSPVPLIANEGRTPAPPRD